MKRPVRIPVLLALVLLGSGCAAFTDSGTAARGPVADRRLLVATAFYPLQFVVERVAGDRAEVQNLTRPGQEPHDLELTVQQSAAIADADLVVVERDLQPAVADGVAENATGLVLEVADVVALRAAGSTEEREDGHDHDGAEADHDHGRSDPHFWLDPARMAELGDAVADRLADLDPDHAEAYRTRAAALAGDLGDLDTAYAEGLAACERTTVVVAHDAFGYLGRYGLDFLPIAGLSPDAEPTPADLARLQDAIADDGVTTVFGERLASPRLAETLADDAGVGVAVLDPIEGLGDQGAEQDYLSLMQQNLAALRQANGCR